MNLMISYFLFSLCVLVSCQNLTGDNVCMDSFGTRRCCKDYKQSGNVCVGCEPGYFGIDCSSTCPSNYYGRRCLEECHCQPFQYCNTQSGCQCNETSNRCLKSDGSSTEKKKALHMNQNRKGFHEKCHSFGFKEKF